MKSVIVVTGASSGFGALIARELAKAGHIVYAGMRETNGRNAPQVEEARRYSDENKVDLRTVEMDVQSEASVEKSIQTIVAESGRLDILIHNAGHMVFGPAEAFTPEQLSDVYDINVVSTQRVNRAALPILRKQGKGLVLWIGSSSTRGGTPPYTAPYFAAKAAMDALATSYAGELARWNIETCIIVPGVFTSGTNHFAHAGHPGDQARASEYATGSTAGLDQEIMTGEQRVSPVGGDIIEVARAVADVVAMPFGTRPFRVHIDPADDGAQVVNAVADRIRAEYLRNIGLQDLLRPSQLRSRKS